MFYWTGGASWYAIGSGKLDQDTWYHLAGTFDGKTLKFYVDGKLVGQKGSKSKCRRQRYIHWMSSKPDQLFSRKDDETVIVRIILNGPKLGSRSPPTKDLHFFLTMHSSLASTLKRAQGFVLLHLPTDMDRLCYRVKPLLLLQTFVSQQMCSGVCARHASLLQDH